MSKKKNQEEKSEVRSSSFKSYSVRQRNGGHFIVEIIFTDNGELLSVKELTVEDVLPITLAKLSETIRRELGV